MTPTDSENLTLFHFEDDKQSFEDLGIANGSRTWKEGDLMKALGYAEAGSFRKAIVRAMQACLSLSMSTEENFILKPDGAYKITRFGCYLVAINADSKKPQVAAAQAYFAKLAESFQTAIEHSEGMERVLYRDEIADGMKSLSSVVSRHGVENYAFFQNAGYRGMYNMDLSALISVKKVPAGQKLLDRIGKVELAANLFRVTLTEERIKTRNVNGQTALEGAAYSVGREVRDMVISNTGQRPEKLPLAAPINEVKKTIKGANKKFKELDGGKAKKK